MRKLASIQKIINISPIEGKDRIGLAQIEGWNCIVPKNEFKEGDLVVFCEPDSVFPKKPEFEFMSKYNYTVRTIKMAGKISQGVVLPMSILPKKQYQVGDDVTSVLGITKREEEEVKAVRPRKKYKNRIYTMIMNIYSNIMDKINKEKSKFPSFISKTDEERIQNHVEYFDYNIRWHLTEKIDGTSSTYYIRKKLFGYEYGVCSRNRRLYKEDSSVYWAVFKKYKLKKVLKSLLNGNKWVAIQGEIIAPNIQRNVYKVQEPTLYVYSIVYPYGRLSYKESELIAQEYCINHVPLLNDGKPLNIQKENVQSLLNMATAPSVLNFQTIREGIVFRATNGAASFKAVSPEYLLKHHL